MATRLMVRGLVRQEIQEHIDLLLGKSHAVGRYNIHLMLSLGIPRLSGPFTMQQLVKTLQG